MGYQGNIQYIEQYSRLIGEVIEFTVVFNIGSSSLMCHLLKQHDI